MKKLTAILLSISFFIISCSKKELSREEAAVLIKKEMKYPKTFDFEINRVDPVQARRVLEAGLEEEGLLTVQRSQKLKDIGKPLIHFTSKAQPFFLSKPNENPEKVQTVKLADEEFAAITGIKASNDGKSAVVEYITEYKNITPFADLVNHDLTKPETHKAYFSLYDDGWRLEKNLGIEFIGLEE